MKCAHNRDMNHPTTCPQCEAANTDDRPYCSGCSVVFASITPERIAAKAAHRSAMLSKTAASARFFDTTVARLLAEKNA